MPLQSNLGDSENLLQPVIESPWLSRAPFPEGNASGRLAVTYGKIGSLLFFQGNIDGAFPNFQNALALNQRLVDANPQNFPALQGVFISLQKVGDVLERKKDFKGSLASHEKALVIVRAAAGG